MKATEVRAVVSLTSYRPRPRTRSPPAPQERLGPPACSPSPPRRHLLRPRLVRSPAAHPHLAACSPRRSVQHPASLRVPPSTRPVAADPASPPNANALPPSSRASPRRRSSLEHPPRRRCCRRARARCRDRRRRPRGLARRRCRPRRAPPLGLARPWRPHGRRLARGRTLLVRSSSGPQGPSSSRASSNER